MRFIPDLVPWLLVVSALLLLTGLARALLVFRALRVDAAGDRPQAAALPRTAT